jgi:hypothetical protein
MAADLDPPAEGQHWHGAPGAAFGCEKCRHLGKGLCQWREVSGKVLGGRFFFCGSIFNSAKKNKNSDLHLSKAVC